MNALSSLFALVILLFAGYYYVTVIAAKAPPKVAPKAAVEQVEEAEPSLGDWVRRQFETEASREQLEEARSLAKLKQLEALEKGRKVIKLHDRLLFENKAFSAEVSKLLRDARGRRIAASEPLVTEFEETRASLPVADDVRFLRVKLDLLLQPLKKAALNKRSVYVPEEETLSTIWDLEAEISGLAAQVGEARKKLDSIVSRATGEASETTLGELLKIRAKGGR